MGKKRRRRIKEDYRLIPSLLFASDGQSQNGKRSGNGDEVVNEEEPR